MSIVDDGGRPVRARRRSEAHHEDFVAVPYLRQGQSISLIRWTRDASGWTYTTLLVEYRYRDDADWHVVADGENTRMSRDVWAIFT